MVVGILAALVALALPFYQDYVNQSKLTAAEADLQTFKKALAMYDQLEPTMFNPSPATLGMLPLIGKYMQDFRTYTGQAMPNDPWGVPYVVRPAAGTIISAGPDSTIDTTDVTARVAVDDDILVTWKPPFIISNARMINATTVEISFSRKINTVTVGTVTVGPSTGAGTAQKISDTIYRFTIAPALVAGTHNVAVGTISSQDGKSGLDTRPDGITPKVTY